MESDEDVVAKVSITTCLVMNAMEFLCFMVIFYDMHKERRGIFVSKSSIEPGIAFDLNQYS